MKNATVYVETVASQQDIAAISEILNQYNSTQGVIYNPQALSVFIRDEQGTVLAGLTGCTLWGWLHIKVLAVSAEARSKGLGTKLMEAAEKEAKARGCKHALVDTFSFQAQPFYEKCGYEPFAELGEFPDQFSRIYLRKQLLSQDC